jgi:hypothetical protein
MNNRIERRREEQGMIKLKKRELRLLANLDDNGAQVDRFRSEPDPWDRHLSQ